MVYPSLSGAPRPASLPSIRAEDSSSKLGSSICRDMRKIAVKTFLEIHITDLQCLCLHDVYMDESDQTSSKNCCVRRRICLSSVSSRKFFFRASWLVLISFNSFSSFSNVACHTRFIVYYLIVHLHL